MEIIKKIIFNKVRKIALLIYFENKIDYKAEKFLQNQTKCADIKLRITEIFISFKLLLKL